VSGFGLGLEHWEEGVKEHHFLGDSSGACMFGWLQEDHWQLTVRDNVHVREGWERWSDTGSSLVLRGFKGGRDGAREMCREAAKYVDDVALSERLRELIKRQIASALALDGS
jgi:hypothetical protein